jgi:hypothetical protein
LTFACAGTLLKLASPATASSSLAPGASISSTPPGHWEIVSSANPSATHDNPLYGVACANRSDCWAVGYELSSTRGYETLIEQNNGTDWTLTSSPNTGSTRVLNSVACNSATDCWAVGGFTDMTNNFQNAPLIEHNTGNGWTVVRGQLGTGSTDSYLDAISCLGQTDCWAVGSQTLEGGQQQPLAQHFDGTSWTVATSVNPNPGLWNVLTGVSCASSNDCWAVGYYNNGSVYQAQIEHYDGSLWSVVRGPVFIPAQQNVLNSVFCNSGNDCWAVGYDISTTTHVFETLIEHYDGNAWTVASSPQIALSNELIALTCTSASDCWAVGNQDNGTAYQTLIEHYDGNGWTIFNSDNTGASESNLLNNVTCLSAKECWAVGYFSRGGFSQTLIEHYTVPVPLTSVVSRKVHGGAGIFDIDLTSGAGIECRSGGPIGDYTLVFNFANILTNVGQATVTSGAGDVSSKTIGSDGHQFIVELTGVSTAQRITMTLNDVTDSDGDWSSAVSASMGVLLGDVNGTGRTDSGDVTSVRNHTVSVPDQQSSRYDVNADGRIDAGDVTVTRNSSVTVLP